MEFRVKDGRVTIECSVLEGKVLMQGANLMSHDMDNVEDHIVQQHATDFGCTTDELHTAIEECITTLPHEDDPAWND